MTSAQAQTSPSQHKVIVQGFLRIPGKSAMALVPHFRWSIFPVRPAKQSSPPLSISDPTLQSQTISFSAAVVTQAFYCCDGLRECIEPLLPLIGSFAYGVSIFGNGSIDVHSVQYFCFPCMHAGTIRHRMVSRLSRVPHRTWFMRCA